MKVLITGASGFLGRHLIRELVSKNYEVIAFCRSEIPLFKELGVNWIKGDITKIDEIEAALNGVDGVFHVASMVGMWGNYEDFYSSNVVGTKNVFFACQKSNVKRLVYTSSPSVVFGKDDLEGVNESTPYPEVFLTHYAKTKSIAEKFILESNGKKGVITTSLRPHLIYGEDDPNLIPRLVAKATKGKLVQVGDGSNLIDVIYVKNAVDAHILAFEALSPNSKNAGKAYFIGQERPVNCWDFINSILEQKGAPKVKKSLPTGVVYFVGKVIELIFRIFMIKKVEPPMTGFIALQLGKSHFFDQTAAKNDFDYRPSISVEESIRRL